MADVTRAPRRGAGARPGAFGRREWRRFETTRLGAPDRAVDRNTWTGTPPPASERRRTRQDRGNAALERRRRTGGTSYRDGLRVRRVRGAAGELGNRTPWACVAEKGHRVRGGSSRQGRGKRQRRNRAGVETRDEVRCGRAGAIRNVAGGVTLIQRNTTWASPGTGFPGLSASKGRRTPREVGPGHARWSRTGAENGTGAAGEMILEGGCKARSGIQSGRETDQMASVRKTPGATSRGGKVEGGAAKSSERLRTVVRH